jgi:LmbE family N-acetylglucosaminyl deacetylase
VTATDEDEWRNWLASPELRPFPDERHEHVVVVAAHPDDETLGASGLLQHWHQNGTSVDIVVATDGEAAFPTLSTSERQELGLRRRRELHESLHAQGMPDVAVHWLGLPDSGLTEHRAELADRLTAVLVDADLCLAPWPGDPHPDHQTVADVALDVTPVTAHRWSYPIWMWHWLRPADIPGHTAFTHRLDERQRRRKAAGVASFVSQLTPGPDGCDAILRPEMLRHFERDVEVFFRQPSRHTAPISRFTQLYDEDDPWGVATTWYERRKRATVLAALPRERYGTAVEPACGTGILTRDLADRCDRVLASDPVPAAVRRCREHTADLPHVDVSVGALPVLPAVPADLVVFSEILYYLNDEDLTASVDAAVDLLGPDGHLVAVHWLPWAAEAPRDGMAVHRFLLAHPGLTPLVEHRDERFVLHVLGRR